MLSIARQSSLRQIRIELYRTQQSAFARLLSSLAVLEQKDGVLQSSSLSAVTAAQKLGGSITGIVAGSNVERVAEDAVKVRGLEKIITIENGAYDKVDLFRSSCLPDSHLLMVQGRGFRKTTRRCSLKILNGEGSHTSSRRIRRLVRT